MNHPVPDRDAAHPDSSASFRMAGPGDISTVTAVLVDAFAGDDIWGSWAFEGDRESTRRRQQIFELLVRGALRHRWVWMTGGAEAVSLWVPPGRPELSQRQERALMSMIRSWPSPIAGRIVDSFDRFEAARPRTPHFYLTLLATDPRQAGHGHGRRLLQDTLRRIDADGAPAYLEAATSLVPFYESFGFNVMTAFPLPDGPTVNTMWRPSAGGGSVPQGGPVSEWIARQADTI
jgi:ribosomal protein S18 acetylase RimI-like enzyme